MTMPSMNNSNRTVKIAESNGRIFVDGGYHPHFQEAIKDRLDAKFHKERKKWHISTDMSDELDACIQEFFPSAEVIDYRKDNTNTMDKPVIKQKREPSRNPNLIDKLKNAGHIVNLKGKDYILFAGLLVLAHENGLESIDTESVVVNSETHTAVMITRVSGERGTYTGHGDAAPDNLTKMMIPSYLRMAETRAIARALRMYLGIGMTCLSELPNR